MFLMFLCQKWTCSCQHTKRRTFSLSQMNNVELARTLSWRENTLFEERKRRLIVCRSGGMPDVFGLAMWGWRHNEVGQTITNCRPFLRRWMRLAFSSGCSGWTTTERNGPYSLFCGLLCRRQLRWDEIVFAQEALSAFGFRLAVLAFSYPFKKVAEET